MGNELEVSVLREMDFFIMFASNNTSQRDYKNQLESRHKKRELYSCVVPKFFGFYEQSDSYFFWYKKLSSFFIYILPKIGKYPPSDQEEWKARCAGFLKMFLRSSNIQILVLFYEIVLALRKQYDDRWVCEVF